MSIAELCPVVSEREGQGRCEAVRVRVRDASILHLTLSPHPAPGAWAPLLGSERSRRMSYTLREGPTLVLIMWFGNGSPDRTGALPRAPALAFCIP